MAIAFIIIIPFILWFIVVFAVTTSVNRAYRAQDNERIIFWATFLTLISPFNTHFFHLRGMAYNKLGQTDNAIKDFVHAIKLKKGSFQSYYALLDILCVKNRVEKFAPYANEIMRFLPKHAESYNLRGVYYLFLENYEDALADFEKALAIFPTELRYISNQAWALYKLGNVDSAKKIYDDVVEKHSTFLPARQNLVLIAIEEKRFEEALPLANALLKMNNATAFIFQLRSRIYRNLERYEEALTDIEFALRLQPTEPAHYLGRGLTYLIMENYDSAIADFTQAIALAPLEACPYVDRGVVYIEIDRIDEAHADALKAYELEADSKYAISLLALTRFMRGEMDEAKTLWREMVDLDERYMDMTWTAEELGWRGWLVSEGEKLIATL